MNRISYLAMAVAIGFSSVANADSFTISDNASRLIDFHAGTYRVSVKAFEKASPNPSVERLTSSLNDQKALLADTIERMGYSPKYVRPLGAPEINTLFVKMPAVEPSPHIEISQIEQIIEIYAPSIQDSDMTGVIEMVNWPDTEATQVGVWGDIFTVNAPRSLTGNFIPFHLVRIEPLMHPDEMTYRHRETYNFVRGDMISSLYDGLEDKCVSQSRRLDRVVNCQIENADLVIDERFEPDEGQMNRLVVDMTATW